MNSVVKAIGPIKPKTTPFCTNNIFLDGGANLKTQETI